MQEAMTCTGPLTPQTEDGVEMGSGSAAPAVHGSAMHQPLSINMERMMEG